MTDCVAGAAAFGRPGLATNWTNGNKDGVGTAFNAASRIWFTTSGGIITEIYFPTIDQPQVRDLQLAVTDGATFLHREQQLFTEIKPLSPHSLGYHITNSDPDGAYSIIKQTITDPHLPCLLQHIRIIGSPEFLSAVKMFLACTPHLGIGGAGNNAYVIESAGRKLLAAEKSGLWLVLGASVPFTKVSCGYSGVSDGWTDLSENLAMDWEFTSAVDGNVSLTGELDLRGGFEFTVGLALGGSLQSAVNNFFQSISIPFAGQRKSFEQQWEMRGRDILPLEKYSEDDGELYRASTALLSAHEDKTYSGAFIASLSIPWGETTSNPNTGGYHLVWTRDLVNSVTGLLAAGDSGAARRALIYLATAQQPDGGFPQNFWLDGRPYWQGIQLDEVALPIILAARLRRSGMDTGFDEYEMVMRAAAYLVRLGPATGQDRWEEAPGYSPSTLAVNIAALICAAGYARDRGDMSTAVFLEEYADFLEAHLEIWTVTNHGKLIPDVQRHFIRINPVATDNSAPDENPENKVLNVKNRAPGQQAQFPARDIVDAGFLELVHYGIRRVDDPLIIQSLKVVDAVLKTETPFGPVWRRYNHDGYGQRSDGGAYDNWGAGRPWPLLTGERGHFELAAGGDVAPYIKAMEGFASYTGLLPEQVWDESDNADLKLFLGRPTGAAMPLMWAHAEYIKLLRSKADGAVFDLVPEVAARYLDPAVKRPFIEIWKPNRHAKSVPRGGKLRIQAPQPFVLVWTADEWQHTHTSDGTGTKLGLYFTDLVPELKQTAPFRFTFLWKTENRWEGMNYEVAVN